MTRDPGPARPSVPTADRSTLPGREPCSLPPLVLEAPAPAGFLVALQAGARMGRQRLLRRPTALAALLGLALAVVGALIERRAGSSGAVDRALGGTFRLVIPLVTFGLAGEVAGRTRLREGVWPAARFGLPSSDVALGVVLVASLASAALGAALALISVAVAHTPAAAPLVTDALLSAWIGALTGAAYAGWFAFGSTFLARGRGRWVVLVADFLAGGSAGILGAVFPRGNARNLLGGEPPLALSQPGSSVLLAAAAVLLALGASVRSRD